MWLHPKQLGVMTKGRTASAAMKCVCVLIIVNERLNILLYLLAKGSNEDSVCRGGENTT